VEIVVVKSYQMANMSLKSTETHGLKVLMAQRELSVSALAASCGVESVTLSNQISKNFPSQRLRLTVEHALKLPIWSTSADFASRQNLIACCGFDPYRLTAEQLYQYLTELKIRGRSTCCRRRHELIALLQSALRTKTSTTPKKSNEHREITG
jgi:hypothetical protein